MPTSADIGANFSSYQGNPNLGGGTLGVMNIDLRPISQLAQYTFLYHRSEYEQRQKDAEKAAAEIADLTNYDLATGIEKDSKQLRDKYDTMLKFVRDNPDAVNYRDRDKYLEFKRMQNELANDIAGAKVRDVTYKARVAEIQKNTNKEMAALDMRDLVNEIDNTSIRTPLKVAAQFDVAIPEFKAPPGLTFDVYKAGENEDQKRKFTIFNVPQAREQSIVDELDLTKSLDPNTPEGERRAISRGQNFYTKGTDLLNSALKDPAYRDANGKLDETKLKGLAKGMIDLIKKANTYLENTKTEINAGSFKDQFKRPITFGGGLLKEEDYAPINYEDGISPSELSFLAQFAAWQGDTYATTTEKTDDAIQHQNLGLGYARIAEDKRQFDLTPHGTGATAGEPSVVMNLTGYTGGKDGLSVADMYAIDPSYIDNNFGVPKLSQQGAKVKLDILPNGDVAINPKYKDGKLYKYDKIITKESYQKRAIEYDQTNLKERKGQSQLPFTNTGVSGGGAATNVDDTNMTEAEYFIKYKKKKPGK